MNVFRKESLNDVSYILSEIRRISKVEKDPDTGEIKVSYVGQNIQLYEEYMLVLSGFVNVSEDIPDFVLHGALRVSASNFQKKETQAVEDFVVLVRTEIAKYQRHPKKKFYLVTSLSLKIESSYIRTLHETRISILKNLPKKFELDITKLQIYQPEDFRPTGYTYIVLSGYARSPKEAGERLSKELDFYRSLLNFFYNINRYTIFSGELRPYNPILTGKYQVLFNDDGKQCNDHWWYVPDWVKVSFPKSFENRESFDFLVKKISSLSKAPKLYPVIKEGLLQYNSALDHKDRDLMVEKLWLPMEILTGTSGRNDSKDRTIERAISILTKDKDRHRMVLRRAMELRNRFVHAGVGYQLADEVARAMRARVEALLSFLIFNAQLFSTKEELVNFFDYLRDEKSYDKLIRIQKLMKKLKVI